MLTPAERRRARRDLVAAWGDCVRIEAQPDGCLLVDVCHGRGGGHTFAQISSPGSVMLAMLTAGPRRAGALPAWLNPVGAGNSGTANSVILACCARGLVIPCTRARRERRLTTGSTLYPHVRHARGSASSQRVDVNALT